MALIDISLYKTRIVDGRVVGDSELTVITIDDADNDDGISWREWTDFTGGVLGHTSGDGTHLLWDGDNTGSTKAGFLCSDVRFNNGDNAQSYLDLLGKNFSPVPIANLQVPCFTAGTMIDTEHGPVAIEELAVGTKVRTRDAGLQPVRWIGQRVLAGAELAAAPALRPVRIRAGALGDGVPSTDLVVSPQHRVLIRSSIARRMFGTDEVLVSAKQLVQLPGIDIASDMEQVTYVHFLCDQHHIVWSNGAQTETLFTGAEAMNAVGPAAAAEILSLFPQLAEGVLPKHARCVPPARMARKLAARHGQNRKALFG